VPFFVVLEDGQEPRKVEFDLHLAFTSADGPRVNRSDLLDFPSAIHVVADDKTVVFTDEHIGHPIYQVSSERIRGEYLERTGKELSLAEAQLFVRCKSPSPAVCHLAIRIRP
jgi:hypothetical protein